MYQLSESKIRICNFTINKKIGLSASYVHYWALQATINYDLDMKDRFTS